MLLAGGILPRALIKGLPQGFPAEVVFCLGGQKLRAGQIPMGAAQNVAGKPKSLGFQFPPEGIFFLLLQDVVPAEKIP